MVGKGSRLHDIYVLHVAESQMPSMVNQVSAEMWHNQVGHLSLKTLQTLKDALEFSDYKNKKVCFICPLAKQKRLPYVSHNRLAEKPFDIVHGDIWGPFDRRICVLY